MDPGGAVNGLEFGRAELWPWLLLLPLLVVVVHLLLGSSRRLVVRYGAASRDSVPAVWARTTRLSLLALLGLVCWLDPRQGEEVVAIERRGLNLIFCLDTSRSMLASDLEPDRLSRAKQDIRSVLPRLVGGDRAGLVVFAGDARLWIPLTHDLSSFERLLEEVDTTIVPLGGTDLAKALERCGELADPDNVETTAVVMLTDGEDQEGRGQAAARALAKRGITVHAVGYGSILGSKIAVTERGEQVFLRDEKTGEEVVSRMDAAGLRELAEATGGAFVRADAMALPLRQLYDLRVEPMEKRSFDAGEEKAKKARYQWVLLPMLLILLYEMWTAGGRSR